MFYYGLLSLLGLAFGPDESANSLPAVAVSPAAVREARDSMMSCGAGVPLCGVLTLETGEGPGLYGHPTPSVHGLWPSVGSYGTSACIRPTRTSADPARLYPCYAVRGGEASQELWFEKHEWGKHGTCAGVANATDFFGQVCALSARPLSLLSAARDAKKPLSDMSAALTAAGFAVFSTDEHNSQIELSACASNDGHWRLAAVSSFPTVCKGSVPPTPKPSSVCLKGRHGPPCKGDADCAAVTGCVRCARSGFCTDVKLPPRGEAAVA